MSLLYGRVLGTRLLGNRRFNVGLIFIKKISRLDRSGVFKYFKI